jgi:hypothetical protein
MALLYKGRLLAARRPKDRLSPLIFADLREANSLPYSKPQLTDKSKFDERLNSYFRSCI